VIQGWKSIAAALSCSPRTAQRWALSGRFSVFKVPGKKSPRVYARGAELESWRRQISPPWQAEPNTARFQAEAPTGPGALSEYLWGWKAIARFMNTSVWTAQRWWHEAKLPIHRLKTGRRPSPYAAAGELLTWVRQKTLITEQASEMAFAPEMLPPIVQGFMDASPAHVALLDAKGVIIAVNRAWREFGKRNGYRDPTFGVGVNYLELCTSRKHVDSKTGCQMANGLRAVLAGKRRGVQVKYQCDTPATGRRVFLLSAIRFDGLGAPVLVVRHFDVTRVF